VVEKYAILV